MDSELMRRDVHPAEVYTPDGALLRDVRVFVTSHRLLVWANEGGEMSCVLEVPLVESVMPEAGSLNGESLRLVTDDGEMFVNAGTGCGCGSPLKHLGLPAPWRA